MSIISALFNSFGRQGSLQQRAVIGSIWTFGGYGGAQVVRFASNLALTRLLAPEYFGLMALIMVLLIGLSMFSDLGIGPNIMQSDRAEDQSFLDTAFTLQFLRGVFLWVVCLIAAYPFAQFYHEPILAWLVPVVGLSVLISGLSSTKLATANRELNLGKLTMLELGAQAATAIGTIAYAWFSPSVWALAFGTIFGTAIKVVASLVLLPGRNNRFRWDPQAASNLIHFGKWIFVGTILAFASNSMGSLILGKLVSMTEVGIFSIAVTLSKVIEQAYEQLTQRVLLPVFIRIKDLPIAELRRRVMKVRLGAMALFLPPLWIMVIFGQSIIALLFDKRYHSGGWILQVFSAFSIFTILGGSRIFFLAKGNSFLMMNLSAVRLVSYLGCMLIGYQFAGSNGVIIGMAGYIVPVYLIELYAQRSYNIAMPKVDICAIVLSATIILLGLKLTGGL